MRGKTNQVRWLLCALLVLVVACTVAQGSVIYVDDDAVGTNDGSSWANAYNYLQDAIAIASAGDEIRVGRGIYKPDQGAAIVPGDREAAFKLAGGIALRGGYAGIGALDSDVRDVEIYETILSGDLNSNDNEGDSPSESDPAMVEDNSFRVIVADSTDETAVLDGFTVTAGRRYSARSARMGDTDGLYVNNAGRLTIADCRFTNNHTGAVSVDSSPIFTDCIFEGNAYALDIQEEAVVSLNNCTFLDHHTGITITDSEAALTGCNFERTFWTGLKSRHSTLVLTDCNFTGTEFLGALDIDGGDVELERCVFSGNAGSHGGAVEFTAGTLIASDCVFVNNTSHSGGAIGFRGNLDLRNCHFRSNYSTFEGGALAGYGEHEQTAVVSGCTFTGNTAVHHGGAISLFQRNIVISHCTFTGNRGTGSTIWGLGELEQSVEFRGCIIWDDPAPFQPDLSISRSVTIEYSNIEGGGWPGAGNIDVNPCFADPGYWDPNGTADDPNDDFWIDGDYHLKSQVGRWDPASESWVIDDITSPCIDAGDPNSSVAFEPFPNGGIINMGAYGGTVEASMSPSGIHAKYGGGNGTAEDPYLIDTAEQMNSIGTEPNDWDRHFKLMADIDLSMYTGTDFNIIGYGLFPAFTGVFDGNGHTISNFTYSSTGEPCIGIFGYIYGPNARIINVGMIDPNVDGGTGVSVGSLAGWIDMGTITNCYVTGGNVTGKQQVGGLIGTSAGAITDCYVVGGRVIAEGYAGGFVGSSSGSIIGCYATGNVTGSYRVGGLVGSNNGSIVDCYSDVSVEGQYVAGGLVGYNYKGIVMNCFSTTSVTGKNNTGGLVGENEGQVIDCYCSCTLDAQDKVGGLVGINDGIITASYSSADINGQNEVGGLVGYNTDDAEIDNCYADGDVLGRRYVGGLVGNNITAVPRAGAILSGTIRNCYSVALVSGDQDVGGLVGRNREDGVNASFWDIEASGQTTSEGGMGKTTLEMQDPNTFIDAGWDFVGAPGGPGDIWMESEGGGYPVLIWQYSSPPELPAFSGGSGKPDDPYLISTADELNSIGQNPRLMTTHFKLINDIDLTGVDFYIMASQYYPFRGTFDGNDHTISNFSYTSVEATGVGLFGYVAGGQIKDLGLIDPNIHVDKGDFHGCLVGLLAAGIVTHCYVESGSVTGQDELGGLVGENGSSGAIMNCYFTGSAAGRENVGGLVGQNAGSITSSYSYAGVEGQSAVGGFVGRCAPGEMVNCYARGDVVGQWYVGGLVGSNGARSGRDIGTIRNCYSASAILSSSYKGGLLGADWGGEVSNCFWDIETSGRTTSNGGKGKTTDEMQSAGTFLDAGWDFVDETVNGTEDIWWILEGQDYPRLWWELTKDGE